MASEGGEDLRFPADWVARDFVRVREGLLEFAERLVAGLPAAVDATPVDGEDLLEEALARILGRESYRRPMCLEEFRRILAGTVQRVASEWRRKRSRRLS